MVSFKKLRNVKFDNDEQCIVILLNYLKKHFQNIPFNFYIDIKSNLKHARWYIKIDIDVMI